MSLSKKYAVGFDLNDEMSQISFSSEEERNPETISMVVGEQKFGIPTMLCKRKDINQWYFGEEAKKALSHGEGFMADHLLKKARSGEQIVIEDEEYDAKALLSLFVKRALTLLNTYFKPESIESLVMTVDVLDARTIALLNEIIEDLPIERNKIFVQSYAESIYAYIINQPKELWKHRVYIFDYSAEVLKSYGFYLNLRTKPIVAFIDEEEFTEVKRADQMYPELSPEEKEERMDKLINETLHDAMNQYTISSVYLIGDGFEELKLKNTLKYLCMGRRVFQGKNMYTKGATYSAMEKFSPLDLPEEYLFLGKDKIKCNLGVTICMNGKQEYAALVDGGINWYEALCRKEFMVGDEMVVPLVITPLNGKDVEHVDIILDGLPERPPRTMRISIRITFKSENLIHIRVSDLGFGEIFPSTGKFWDQEIILE